jgi:hypothetical protein
MKRDSLIVDGELSGTGIRDASVGGYIKLDELGLSAALVASISKWLLEYENAHYRQFLDKAENERLDSIGTAIAKELQAELPEARVQYYSSAYLRRLPVA